MLNSISPPVSILPVSSLLCLPQSPPDPLHMLAHLHHQYLTPGISFLETIQEVTIPEIYLAIYDFKCASSHLKKIKK